jgi:Zn-dependent protease with chaperone function
MNEIVLIPLLVEWVILVTITTASVLVDNKSIYARPKLGLALWFAGFATSGLATIVALALSFKLAFEAWQQASLNQNIWVTIFASFAPWLLIAIGGISIALVSQKIDSVAQPAGAVARGADHLGSPSWQHRGMDVYELDIPVPLVFALGRERGIREGRIIVTKPVLQQLDQSELVAVLDHEYWHIAKNHTLASGAAKLIRLLSFKVVASRLLEREVSHLLELEADRFSARENTKAVLASAIRKLHSGNLDRELRLRLAQLEHVERTATK